MSTLSLHYLSTYDAEDELDLSTYPELRLSIPSLEVSSVEDHEAMPSLEEVDLVIAPRTRGKGFELFASDAIIDEFTLFVGLQPELTFLNYIPEGNPDELENFRIVWNVQRITRLSNSSAMGRAQARGVFAYARLSTVVYAVCPSTCTPCPASPRRACWRCKMRCNHCAGMPC